MRGLAPLFRAAAWSSVSRVGLMKGTKARPVANTRPLGTWAAKARSASVRTGSRRKPISSAALVARSASLWLKLEA